MKYIINEIASLIANTLDIGNRVGNTGYIDIIQKEEIKDDMVKGHDRFGRIFISFISTITYNDGSITETATTLFQRYTDNTDHWMTCGHDGPYLLDTTGGAKLDQIKFIQKLIKNRFVIIDNDRWRDIYKLIVKNDNNVYPIRIDIGNYVKKNTTYIINNL